MKIIQMTGHLEVFLLLFIANLAHNTHIWQWQHRSSSMNTKSVIKWVRKLKMWWSFIETLTFQLNLSHFLQPFNNAIAFWGLRASVSYNSVYPSYSQVVNKLLHKMSIMKWRKISFYWKISIRIKSLLLLLLRGETFVPFSSFFIFVNRIIVNFSLSARAPRYNR